MTDSNKFILEEIKPLIVQLRRQNNTDQHWPIFKQLIEDNLEQVCNGLDTRWLISIADTYSDYGNPTEKRNALYISMIANFEKLWATNLLMYDLKLNNERLKKLKNNEVIPLWDGMYSFNINRGDMTRNLFGRLFELQKETPVLEKVLETVLQRMQKNETTLANLAKYHKRLLIPAKKKSLLKILLRKIRMFFREYKLFF
jgi:hypothetical protein